MNASPGPASRRLSYAVVGGLAALVVATALVGIALTAVGLAYAWGYVVAGAILGGTCLMTVVGWLLMRRLEATSRGGRQDLERDDGVLIGRPGDERVRSHERSDG